MFEKIRVHHNIGKKYTLVTASGSIWSKIKMIRRIRRETKNDPEAPDHFYLTTDLSTPPDRSGGLQNYTFSNIATSFIFFYCFVFVKNCNLDATIFWESI